MFSSMNKYILTSFRSPLILEQSVYSAIFRKNCGSPFQCCPKKSYSLITHPKTSPVTQLYFSEIDFAHKVLERSPLYQKILAKVDYKERPTKDISEQLKSVDWPSVSPSELVILFEQLSECTEVPISHSDCVGLRSSLAKCCPELTDEQLASVLFNLTKWPPCSSPKQEEFYGVWKSLDNVCRARWKKWSLDTVFYFMDLWYYLHLSKFSDFVFLSVTKFAHYPEKIRKEHIIPLLFHLSLLRGVLNKTKMFEMEYKLYEYADELTLDEIAVGVMGFFKGDKSLHMEGLMIKLIDRLEAEIKSISDIAFSSIIKVLRKSLPPPLWGKMDRLCDAIVPEINRLSVPAAAHAALLTTRSQNLHPPLLTAVSQKLVDNISDARLKDIEKTVFPLAQLVYNPETNPPFVRTVLEELDRHERATERAIYPKSFIALIHYLCLKQVYSEKWISKVLDPDFISRAYGPKKFMFGRELLFIDCCVELEFPSYQGPRLAPDIRHYMSKRYAEYLPKPERKMSRQSKWQYEVNQLAEILFGKENVCVKYLLPHHPRADIVVHLDENKNPLPLSPEVQEAEDFTDFIRSPNSNYYAIIPFSDNMFLYQSKKINGESTAKLRQLELIGYTPVIVTNEDILPTMGMLEKTEYLRNILNSAVK